MIFLYNGKLLAQFILSFVTKNLCYDDLYYFSVYYIFVLMAVIIFVVFPHIKESYVYYFSGLKFQYQAAKSCFNYMLFQLVHHFIYVT